MNPSPVNLRVVEDSPQLEEAFHRRKGPVWISRRMDETYEAAQCTLASVELMPMLKKKSRERSRQGKRDSLWLNNAPLWLLHPSHKPDRLTSNALQ